MLSLSQEELASRCGLSKTYLVRLESASKTRPENPSVSTLDALAKGLSCDIEDLLTKRPSKKLLKNTTPLSQGKALAESVREIRTEHVALLIELAQALRELAEQE